MPLVFFLLKFPMMKLPGMSVGTSLTYWYWGMFAYCLSIYFLEVVNFIGLEYPLCLDVDNYFCTRPLVYSIEILVSISLPVQSSNVPDCISL